MSQFTKKVVAVLDTQSAFGVTIKSMRDSLNTLTAGQVSVLTTQPSNPSEGQLWFDKSSLKMKIYINDGNSNQWVEI
jgi:hypothetical protein